MEIKYFLQNVKLTPRDKEIVEKKINKLNKYSVKILEAKLDLSFNDAHSKYEQFRVEVNLMLPNKLIRGEERSANLQGGLDEVMDELERQLKKYKSKKETKRRRARRDAKEGKIS